MFVKIALFLCVWGLSVGGRCSPAQTVPDANVGAALNSLGARAAVVFAGEVTAVRHSGGVVDVEFRIDQTLKGPISEKYVLREWAGLWAAGQRRYWVGERAVLFLHQPGKSGLSSTVDGMEGVLPLTPTSASVVAVDVERLRTRVQRAVGAPIPGAGVRLSMAEVATAVAVETPPIAPPRPRPVPRPIRRRPIELLPYDSLGGAHAKELPELLLPAFRAAEGVDVIH